MGFYGKQEIKIENQFNQINFIDDTNIIDDKPIELGADVWASSVNVKAGNEWIQFAKGTGSNNVSIAHKNIDVNAPENLFSIKQQFNENNPMYVSANDPWSRDGDIYFGDTISFQMPTFDAAGHLSGYTMIKKTIGKIPDVIINTAIIDVPKLQITIGDDADVPSFLVTSYDNETKTEWKNIWQSFDYIGNNIIKINDLSKDDNGIIIPISTQFDTINKAITNINNIKIGAAFSLENYMQNSPTTLYAQIETIFNTIFLQNANSIFTDKDAIATTSLLGMCNNINTIIGNDINDTFDAWDEYTISDCLQTAKNAIQDLQTQISARNTTHVVDKYNDKIFQEEEPSVYGWLDEIWKYIYYGGIDDDKYKDIENVDWANGSLGAAQYSIIGRLRTLESNLRNLDDICNTLTQDVNAIKEQLTTE